MKIWKWFGWDNKDARTERNIDNNVHQTARNSDNNYHATTRIALIATAAVIIAWIIWA